MRVRIAGACVLCFLLIVPVVSGAPGKNEKEYLDGILLDFLFAQKERTTVVHTDTMTGHTDATQSFDNYDFTVRVGRVTYVGRYSEMLFGKAFRYTPKPDDWPVNSSVQVRIERESRGPIAPSIMCMYIKRPNGKEVKTELIHVIGADGVDKCKQATFLGSSHSSWTCTYAWKK